MLYFISFIAGGAVCTFLFAILIGNAVAEKIREARTKGYWEGWNDRGKADKR